MTSRRDIFLKIIKNKYVITLIVFGVWITFFDEHDLISKYQIKSKIENLNEARERYEERIELDRSKIEELTASKEKLEKFAREEYLMHKEDEDVYIVERTD